MEITDRAKEKWSINNNKSKQLSFWHTWHVGKCVRRTIGNKQLFTHPYTSQRFHHDNIFSLHVRKAFTDKVLYQFPVDSSSVCYLHQPRSCISPQRVRVIDVPQQREIWRHNPPIMKFTSESFNSSEV